MSQFHEPWEFLNGNCDSKRSGGTIVNSHGEEIACDATDANHFPDDDHWERIIACVNALRGVPTEFLQNHPLTIKLTPELAKACRKARENGGEGYRLEFPKANGEGWYIP